MSARPEVKEALERSSVPFSLTSEALARLRADLERWRLPPAVHRLLIVDDDSSARDLFRQLFAAPEYEVTAADDAARALQLVGVESFDLVVADLAMPHMSGVALIDALPRRTRVIIWSGYDAAEVKRVAREARADGWVVKGSSVDALVAEVRTVLGLVPA